MPQTAALGKPMESDRNMITASSAATGVKAATDQPTAMSGRFAWAPLPSTLLRTVAAALLLSLAACGGGSSSSGGSGETPNLAPNAEAGPPATVMAGTAVILDGSGSDDPDGTITALAWEQLEGPPVELDAPTAAQTSFTAPDVATTTALLFSLTATDDAGASSTDTVRITIEPPAAGYRLSGRLVPSASQALDSDTNNPDIASRNNDTPGAAQRLSNPITLGGYLNRPGEGESGRSQEAGDEEDFFRVDLLAGQSVTMLVADFERADADLYLYNSAGEIVDFSVETGQLETIRIAASDTYFINPSIFSGATNYILAIGDQADAQGAAAEIIPWQAYVVYRAPAGGPDLTAEDLAYSMGMVKQAGDRRRGELLQLSRDGLAPGQQSSRLQGAIGKRDLIPDPALRARWETLLSIKSLSRDPRVALAEPNYRVRALAEPDDSAYGFQWHLPLIELPAAWEVSTGAANVVVAVVDSGVLPSHPDLAGQFVDGYDFVRDPGSALDGDGIDPDPTDPGGSDPGSNSFHGTHVSGTVAASGNNGIGVAGVAYTSRVMPLRALGRGGAGTTYDIRQAVRYAAGLANDSGRLPPAPADIINLSLGGAPPSQADQALFEQLYSAGITVVAAAGNESSRAPSYPAAYSRVISVSAVDAQRQLTGYSNTGPTIDVAAPGGDNGVDLNGDGYPDGVLSTGATLTETSAGFAYTFLSGTSMAAPHVAGVIALMKSVNPELQASDITALLASGELTDDLGATGRDDHYGHGLINAQRAVTAALASDGLQPAQTPRLTASASSLSFSAGLESLRLEFSNAGSDALTLLSLRSDSDWLDITPLSTDTGGLGSYRLDATRDGLEPGTYRALITAVSTANTVTVRVLMTVQSDQSVSGVGIAYVLLYDADTDEPVAQFGARGENGDYRFDFADVPPGRYNLYAGTDSDNDLLICDNGEACGAWLSLDQPITITLDTDRDNLDFPIDFQVAIPSLRSLPGAIEDRERRRLH